MHELGREARAPGRINLIGEHIDYHDLGVMPMALDRAVRIHFRPLDEPRVRLQSELPGTRPVDLPLTATPPRHPGGHWANYVAAAVAVAVARHGASTGIEGFIRSDLPAAAGVSSSSALVVAVTLALLDASGLDVDRLRLAGELAEGERFVGTQGGGMDQAASLLGRAGHALRVDFAPLRARPLAVPPDWCFVVADSGVRAEKSGDAQAAYNERRETGRAVLQPLARALGSTATSWPALLEDHTADEVVAAAAAFGPAAPVIRHVAGEAARVMQAEAALAAGDAVAFGRLMNASHDSLRDDYRVSHPRLDRLVGAARAAGAHGARLTGAGFGGCVIALCDASREAALHACLDAELSALGVADGARLVFTARSGDGAGVSPVS